MVVKSKIQGTINDYLRTVTSIEIDGNIMIFKSTLKDICIDTKRGVSSTTVRGLKNAKRKLKSNSNKTKLRDVFNVPLAGRENNTAGNLAQLIAVGKYIIENNITEYEGYEGHEANHIDYSGNLLTRGFSNNSLNNIEYVSKDENGYHNVCEQRLHRLFGRYFGFSGADTELINKIRFLDDTELRQYLTKIGNNIRMDEYGTVYIGTAARDFDKWNNIHKKVTF